MKITYNDVSIKNYHIKATANEPELCPCCKHAIKPTVLNKIIIEDAKNKKSLFMTYLCTHCFQAFICKFSNDTYPDDKLGYVFENLNYIAPNKFVQENFEQCIHNISPMFVKIYNQALEAENYNLDQIAGIGYRKALEFLIKDFLIFENPEKEEKIKNTALANCINSFIENPQLKTVASRATWLGNDQTHYEQVFKDKDISDLKRLIKLSVNWIIMISLTHEAESIEKP